MFNSYEEYMQNVLGVRSQDTYMQEFNGYYKPRTEETNIGEINKLYPEIYGIVYPMVQKACSKRNIGFIDEAGLNEMVEEIYRNLEPEEEIIEVREEKTNNLKNGDVKNPRIKEPRAERRRNNNPILRDLIKILILRELFQGGWQGGPGGRPPRPPMGGMPGMRWTTEASQEDHGRKTTNYEGRIYGHVLKQLMFCKSWL